MWNAELSQIVSVRVLCLASKILGKKWHPERGHQARSHVLASFRSTWVTFSNCTAWLAEARPCCAHVNYRVHVAGTVASLFYCVCSVLCWPMLVQQVLQYGWGAVQMLGGMPECLVFVGGVDLPESQLFLSLWHWARTAVWVIWSDFCELPGTRNTHILFYLLVGLFSPPQNRFHCLLNISTLTPSRTAAVSLLGHGCCLHFL